MPGGEAVREDVVDHRVLHPIGNFGDVRPVVAPDLGQRLQLLSGQAAKALVPSSAQAHRWGASHPSGTLTTTGTISTSSAAKAVRDSKEISIITEMRIAIAFFVDFPSCMLLGVSTIAFGKSSVNVELRK